MANVFDKLSDTQRFIASGIVGFLLGVVLTSLWFISQGDGQVVTGEVEIRNGEDEVKMEEPDVQEVLVENASRVDVDDQPAGLEVRLTEAVLASDGWVAVHEMTTNGRVGNILGAARFDKGTSRGSVELLRATVSGETYVLRLYSDNGNRAFEPKLDPLVVGDDKEPVEDTFIAR